MVRRRPSKSKGQNSGPRPVDRKDGNLKKWNTVDDILMDEEDQFHASRDHILLEGEDHGDDDDGDEEDVFSLKGLASSDSDEDETRDEELDLEDQEAEEEKQPKKKAKTKSKGKTHAELTADGSEEDESEEDETWGRSKSAYYSSNAAELESDDEEANELEEQEAKRLQTKARDAMAEEDFGLGEAAEVNFQEDDNVEELLEPPQANLQPLPQDRKSLIRHLEKTSPETLALADDWDDIARKLVYTQNKLKQLENQDSDSLSQGMLHLHYQALLTYATNLAFYLHLRASEKYAQRPEALRAHPVFSRLLHLKEALSTLEDLDFDMSGSDLDEDEDDEDLDTFINGPGTEFDGKRTININRRANSLDFEDLAQLLREAEEDLAAPALPAGRPKAKKKAGLHTEEPPQKKRKTKAPPPVPFDLEEPEFVPSKRHASTSGADSMEVYGDAAMLGATDAADKSARRKTLRFHTSKIESASARRQGARAALGGDDDVPYRERKKDREARLAKEALARGRGQGGDDLDGEEPAPPPRKRARDDAEDAEGGGEEGDDGYYSLIQQQKKEHKDVKKAEYDAAKAAAKMDLDVRDSADGPRGLTRAILKNRGLTPHRTKSVRNPRVKKRQKFDKAQKKLASQKAVFKAGPRDVTRYEGEKSGITKVVKSVRF
ncbi:Sas10 C-terminal domain-containing protein [Amylostereum chailletii]|nr:Sas10 C-terminal domain-containing protein [Amylostereum chailletii]